MDDINSAAGCQQRCQALSALKENPVEENLWNCVVAFRGYTFYTLAVLSFSCTIKTGRSNNLTKEIRIDRREGSKSLSWSSVQLAYRNIKEIGAIVERPKALGDIRGVSYIYGMFLPVRADQNAIKSETPPCQILGIGGVPVIIFVQKRNEYRKIRTSYAGIDYD